MSRIRVATTAVTTFIAFLPQAQASGNLNSFAKASTAKIDFRATPIRAAHNCTSMASEIADGVRITTSELVAAKDEVPAYCKINGIIPAEIGFQINLPIAWNGRLYMYGNGGFAGEDAEAPLERRSRDTALSNGFATARTDTGHLDAKEPLGTFAVKPDKVVDNAYRAVHSTVVLAKKLATKFYATAPKFSYWDGCSTGGRQGVMSAQRYPTDFNGIVATAPTLRWNDVMVKGLWNQKALDHGKLTPGKMQTVFKAFTAKCDALDGAIDGLVDDPRQCKFSPAVDVKRCDANANDDECLSDREVEALQQIYDGPRDSKGNPLFVGQVPGSEDRLTLAPFIMKADGSPNILTVFAHSWMKYLVFQNPDYDPASFDYDKDPQRMRRLDELYNPTTDLAAFRDAGGKMITFWGWADNALNPQMGINYYDELVQKYSLANTQSFYRFFLVPGLAHCRGGYGPAEVDAMTTLIDWVEGGIASERLPAQLTQDGAVKYQRAYCPYPQLTKYVGSGNVEDPKNHSCK